MVSVISFLTCHSHLAYTIVHEIGKHGDNVTLAKIDIERAFRNLRVDPADAMKLGIKWQNDAYIDAAVVFSWVHGSAAFALG